MPPLRSAWCTGPIFTLPSDTSFGLVLATPIVASRRPYGRPADKVGPATDAVNVGAKSGEQRQRGGDGRAEQKQPDLRRERIAQTPPARRAQVLLNLALDDARNA